MTHSYFLVTTWKQDILSDKFITIIGTLQKIESNDESNGKYNYSSNILLLMCILYMTQNRAGDKWSEKHYNITKNSKHNITNGSSTHFGLEGNYYSYGIICTFTIVDGSSVGQYATNKYTDVNKSARVGFNPMLMKLSINEIIVGVDGLNKVIINLKSLI